MRIVLSCVVVGLLAIVPVLAAEQTWTGQISDSMCGAKHMSGSARERSRRRIGGCAQACVQKGAQSVLVASGKVYKLI